MKWFNPGNGTTLIYRNGAWKLFQQNHSVRW
jgi:hypothetical protein